MSDSFFDDLRKVEKAWSTWRIGQRKYAALICAAGVPLIFLVTHLGMWAREYLSGKSLHDPREVMGGSYLLLLLLIFAGFVAYLEIRTRQRR